MQYYYILLVVIGDVSVVVVIENELIWCTIHSGDDNRVGDVNVKNLRS